MASRCSIFFPPALPLDENDDVALEQPPPFFPPPLSLDEDDVGDVDDVLAVFVDLGQHCGDDGKEEDDDTTKEGRV